MPSPSDDQTRAIPDTDKTVIPGRVATTRTAEKDAHPLSQSEAMLTLPVGTRLNEFEITNLVGEGGFGIVYEAHDHSLDRVVAIKEYMPGALAVRTQGSTISVRSDRHLETFQLGLKSFVNEAKLLAGFDHPSLVKVYRFWEANGTAYMAMPYYQGETLKARIKRAGAPDEAWLCGRLYALLDALEVIHQESVFHRDIAPDNIMLVEDGRPVLLDFGAARRVIGDLTHGLTVILKPGFAPIEQYAEVKAMKQGPWTDVYALAATAYFAIAGKPPEPAVGRMIGDSLVPLTEIGRGRYSPDLLAALDTCLRVKPEDRPQDVRSFRALLNATGHSGAAHIPLSQRAAHSNTRAPEAIDQRSKSAPPRADSPWIPFVLGGIGVALALSVGGYYYVNRGDLVSSVPIGPPHARKPDASDTASPNRASGTQPAQPQPGSVATPQSTTPDRADLPREPDPSIVESELRRPVVDTPSPVVVVPVPKPPPPAPPKPAATDGPRPVPESARSPKQTDRTSMVPKTVEKAPKPAIPQEVERQEPVQRDNDQVLALVARAQQSLVRREFRRALGLADNVLAIDPSNPQAIEIRRQAREGEKKAFEEIKIE